MANRRLIPWRRRGDSSLDVRRDRDSFLSMQDEMNRMFEDFFEKPFGARSLRALEGLEDFTPSLDVFETEKEISIQVELPGMEEKDIDISVHNNVLTVSGKKENEEIEKGKSFYRRERSFGSFRRSVELPEEVDEDKIEATYKNGILNVVVEKPKASVSVSRRIKVKRG